MATAASALTSLEQYLDTVYRPDRDFVDGETERRNVGEFDHNRIQILLGAWFVSHEAEWGMVAVTEQRIRVSVSRVRIADLCALRADAPIEQVTATPPLLCVEVLSPKDRLSRTIQVMEDYLQMGVEHLWVINPRERVGYTYTASGLLKLIGNRFTIAGTPIYVDLPSLFARLPPKV